MSISYREKLQCIERLLGYSHLRKRNKDIQTLLEIANDYRLKAEAKYPLIPPKIEWNGSKWIAATREAACDAEDID